MPGTIAIAKRVSFSSPTPPSTPPTSTSSLSPPSAKPLPNRNQKEAALAQTPTRNLFKTIVVIYVGQERRPFQIHRELLCNASPFFAAAFDRELGFSESNSGSVAFPEIRPTDFEYLVQWLYTHTVRT